MSGGSSLDKPSVSFDLTRKMLDTVDVCSEVVTGLEGWPDAEDEVEEEADAAVVAAITVVMRKMTERT